MQTFRWAGRDILVQRSACLWLAELAVGRDAYLKETAFVFTSFNYQLLQPHWQIAFDSKSCLPGGIRPVFENVLEGHSVSVPAFGSL